MAIPESQLQTWSHPGPVTTSKNTYTAIKGNLEASETENKETLEWFRKEELSDMHQLFLQMSEEA